jgi:hypothetical protein
VWVLIKKSLKTKKGKTQRQPAIHVCSELAHLLSPKMESNKQYRMIMQIIINYLVYLNYIK